MADVPVECKRRSLLNLCFASNENPGPALDGVAHPRQTFVITFLIRLEPGMLSATLKYLFRDLHCLLQRVETWLVGLAAERRCALRLDRVADRLTGMGDKINSLRAYMLEVSGDEPVDENAALRVALKGLKQDIRDIRCQITGMGAPQLSARIQRAITRLNQIAEQTYASADRLQWEIEEHDGRFRVHGGTCS